jgi:hypothetical protein
MIEELRVRDLPPFEREKLRRAALAFAAKGYVPAMIARKLDIASIDVRRWLKEADDGDDSCAG